MVNYAVEFCERPSESQLSGFVISPKVLQDVNEVFDATYTAMKRELKRVCEEKVVCKISSISGDLESKGRWEGQIGDVCPDFETKTNANSLWGQCYADM